VIQSSVRASTRVVSVLFLLCAMSVGLTACSSGSSTASTNGGRTVTTIPKTQESTGKTAAATIVQEISAGMQLQQLPQNMVGQLSSAVDNWFTSRGGHNGGPLITQGYVAGDPSANETVVSFGDSNASMWTPALDALGKSKGFKIIAYTRAACPFADLPGYLPGGKVVDPVCAQWRQLIIQQINQMSPPPVAVVLGQFQPVTIPYPGSTAAQSSWVSGIRKTLDDLHVGAAPKIILVGAPVPTRSVPLCISAHSNNLRLCQIPRPSSHAISKTARWEYSWYLEDQNSSLAGGGQAAWLTNLFCAATFCPPVSAGLIPFAELEHVSTPWSNHVAVAFGELLACSAKERHAAGVDETWLTKNLGSSGSCPPETR